jgi:peptide/nickel transport system substrate-binding protein
MEPETTGSQWPRRAFLQTAGLGLLAASGLTGFPWSGPHAWAASVPTRFVSTWNAPDIMDPHVKYDVGAAAFNLNIYDNLLRYQGNPPEVVPWLAETYESTDGGRKWTFQVRRGVKFHDGSELTAEAVHFSFTRLLTLGKAPAGIFKRMGLTPEHIRVVSPYTIEFHLAQPFGPFRMAIPIVSIVNPTLIKAHEQNGDWAEAWLAQHEAGSGAYRLVKFEQATGFLMERFPEFWHGWEGKHVEEVEIKVIREQSSRTLALMKGDVHMIETLLSAEQLMDKKFKALLPPPRWSSPLHGRARYGPARAGARRRRSVLGGTGGARDTGVQHASGARHVCGTHVASKTPVTVWA